MSNVLLLELEEDIEKRKEALFFLLCFLSETREKATFSASNILKVILILEEDVGTRSKL